MKPTDPGSLPRVPEEQAQAELVRARGRIIELELIVEKQERVIRELMKRNGNVVHHYHTHVYRNGETDD